MLKTTALVLAIALVGIGAVVVTADPAAAWGGCRPYFPEHIEVEGPDGRTRHVPDPTHMEWVC